MLTVQKTTARVLAAASKPYDFEGKSGTSHKAKILIGVETWPCKSTPEQVAALQSKIGKDVEVELAFSCPFDKIIAEIVSFK